MTLLDLNPADFRRFLTVLVRLATSCCPPFRKTPTSYKACVYG
jgi:hypothetical protein